MNGDMELTVAGRSFLTALFGASEYQRWCLLKKEMAFESELLFVRWLMDSADVLRKRVEPPRKSAQSVATQCADNPHEKDKIKCIIEDSPKIEATYSLKQQPQQLQPSPVDLSHRVTPTPRPTIPAAPRLAMSKYHQAAASFLYPKLGAEANELGIFVEGEDTMLENGDESEVKSIDDLIEQGKIVEVKPEPVEDEMEFSAACSNFLPVFPSSNKSSMALNSTEMPKSNEPSVELVPGNPHFAQNLLNKLPAGLPDHVPSLPIFPQVTNSSFIGVNQRPQVVGSSKLRREAILSSLRQRAQPKKNVSASNGLNNMHFKKSAPAAKVPGSDFPDSLRSLLSSPPTAVATAARAMSTPPPPPPMPSKLVAKPASPSTTRKLHSWLSVKRKRVPNVRLDQFMTIRTPDNPASNYKYVCNTCNYTTTVRSNMVRHQRVHTGERDHNCKVCNRAFRERHHMLRHMEKAHNVFFKENSPADPLLPSSTQTTFDPLLPSISSQANYEAMFTAVNTSSAIGFDGMLPGLPTTSPVGLNIKADSHQQLPRPTVLSSSSPLNLQAILPTSSTLKALAPVIPAGNPNNLPNSVSSENSAENISQSADPAGSPPSTQATSTATNSI